MDVTIINCGDVESFKEDLLSPIVLFGTDSPKKTPLKKKYCYKVHEKAVDHLLYMNKLEGLAKIW